MEIAYFVEENDEIEILTAIVLEPAELARFWMQLDAMTDEGDNK